MPQQMVEPEQNTQRRRLIVIHPRDRIRALASPTFGRVNQGGGLCGGRRAGLTPVRGFLLHDGHLNNPSVDNQKWFGVFMVIAKIRRSESQI